MKKILAVIKYIFIKIKNKQRVVAKNICRISFSTEIRAKNSKIRLGKNFHAKSNTHFIAVDGGKLTIGNKVFFNRNCIVVCKEKITIGDNCSFGPNVCIYDHDHTFGRKKNLKNEYSLGEIIIGNNCWIGAGAIILRNTSIGDNCVIGAGSVVKGDIPDNSVVTPSRALNIIPIT